ncbi:MAG: YlbL family protein [Nitriliruptorales bacterium]
MRRLFYSASVGIVAWALFTVPLPLVVFSPAPATPVTEVIEVDGEIDPLTGSLMITTVRVRDDATTSAVVVALFDRYQDITRREQVIPAGVDPNRFFEAQRQVFNESVELAAAVGLRLAGREVQVGGDGARVVGVIEGAPAEGSLRSGDLIVEANGRRIELSTQLANLTSEAEAGDVFDLTVRRGEQTIQRSVELGPLPDIEGRAGLGIFVETVNQRIELPPDVEIVNRSRIGGPSAGLMLSLAVFDLFDAVDLTAGRRIAGTGTVDLSGRIGPIGGIEEKVRGAVLADADVFLAPAGQADAARVVAPPDLEVIAVRTVDDAVRRLSR